MKNVFIILSLALVALVVTPREPVVIDDVGHEIIGVPGSYLADFDAFVVEQTALDFDAAVYLFSDDNGIGIDSEIFGVNKPLNSPAEEFPDIGIDSDNWLYSNQASIQTNRQVLIKDKSNREIIYSELNWPAVHELTELNHKDPGRLNISKS